MVGQGGAGMRATNAIGLILILAFGIVISAGADLAAEQGEIPITTCSEKAREYYLQGRDLMERLRAREARFFFEKAVAADSTFALAYLQLALTQPTMLGFFEKFNRALALADSVSASERMMILAIQAANDGDPLKRREYYQKLAAIHPADERVYNMLGESYFGSQDYTQAIEHYNKAIEINPEFSMPYNMLGYSYRRLGDYAKAEEAFKKYVELIPDDPNPYDSYAELLMKMGKFDQSIDYYQKALKVSPDFGASHLGIASNLNFLDHHEKARAQLRKYYNNALDVGQQRDALFATALSYLDEGKIEDALDVLDQRHILARKDNDLLAMARDYLVVGHILLKTGKYDEALAKYEETVKLIESSDLSDEIKVITRHDFLANSVRVLTGKKDFAAAKAGAEKYRQQIETTNNPFQLRLAHELAGTIALAEGDYDLALTELQQADLLNPYNLYRIAQAYAGKGDKEKARRMCEKAAHFNATNDFNLALIRGDAERMLAEM
jgi:tetratricopeptide (TPR) repeat protein